MDMKNSIFIVFSRIFTILTVFYLLVGCDRTSEPTLRLGTNTWLGYEPLYLARDLGYLDPKGFHLVEYPSSSETIRAFRNNALDGVALTLDEILLLIQDGFDLRAILVTDISLGGDAILGRPGMSSMMDLVGQRVAVESTALGAYMLSRALEINGLSVSDVKVVHQDANEHKYTFEANVADAVVGCEPERTELLRQGAVLLFDSSSIPGEIVDVLAIRREILDENPGGILMLLRGWFGAVEYLTNHSNDAADRMAMRMKMTREEIFKALKGLRIPTREENLELLDGNTPKIVETARKLNETMLANRLIDERVDVGYLPMPGPLKKLIP